MTPNLERVSGTAQLKYTSPQELIGHAVSKQPHMLGLSDGHIRDCLIFFTEELGIKRDRVGKLLVNSPQVRVWLVCLCTLPVRRPRARRNSKRVLSATDALCSEQTAFSLSGKALEKIWNLSEFMNLQPMRTDESGTCQNL